MKRFACLMISAAAMVAAGTAFAAGDAARGEAEFEVCAVCHGEQGEGFEKYGAPRIGGQEDWYIVTSLKNFRAGLRAVDNCDVADVAGTLERAKASSPDYAEIEAELATHFEGGLPSGGACSQAANDVYGPLMRAIALTLADDQAVEDLAAYATTLAPPKPADTIQGDATAGTMGYATCIACHGPGRRGQPGAERARRSMAARLVHGAADGALHLGHSRQRPAQHLRHADAPDGDGAAHAGPDPQRNRLHQHLPQALSR